jgi:hypothetical protein
MKISEKKLETCQSLNDYFVRFESIVNSSRFFGSHAYSDNERANQMLYVFDDYACDMKITDLEKYADFARH